MIVNIVNWLIDILVVVVTGIMSLFPQTPFNFKGFDWGPFGKLIGMIFPVGDMFVHFTMILSSIGIYYAIRWLLRLIKMVG